MRDMLQPGRFLYAYGIFYPEGGELNFEAKHLVFVGRDPDEFALRGAGLVGQARSARSPTSTSAPSSATAPVDYPQLPHRARPSTARRSRRPRQETDTISRADLRLRLGLPDDRRGHVPRRRREGHRVPARALLRGRHRRGHRLLVPRRSTRRATTSARSWPREFGDDYDAIPAYEQIYALAGPTQTYRITGDPSIREDIDHAR